MGVEMTEEWWEETGIIVKWNRDRIEILNDKIEKLEKERDGLQRVTDFVEDLRNNK